MASHAYGGDSPGLIGFHHWGGGGLGVLGSQIAVGGYLDNSIDQAAEANAEFYGIITGEPSGLVFEEVGEDSGFICSSVTANAFYSVPFDLYQWGAKIGSNQFTQTFGTPAVGVNLSVLKMTGGSNFSIGTATASDPPIGLSVVALSGGSTFGTGVVSYTPATSIDLTVATLSGGSSISSGAVTYTAPVPGTTTISAAPMSGGSTISVASVGYNPINNGSNVTVPGSRVVSFNGGTNKVTFDGGINKVAFDGGTNKVVFSGGLNSVTL